MIHKGCSPDIGASWATSHWTSPLSLQTTQGFPQIAKTASSHPHKIPKLQKKSTTGVSNMWPAGLIQPVGLPERPGIWVWGGQRRSSAGNAPLTSAAVTVARPTATWPASTAISEHSLGGAAQSGSSPGGGVSLALLVYNMLPRTTRETKALPMPCHGNHLQTKM